MLRINVSILFAQHWRICYRLYTANKKKLASACPIYCVTQFRHDATKNNKNQCGNADMVGWIKFHKFTNSMSVQWVRMIPQHVPWFLTSAPLGPYMKVWYEKQRKFTVLESYHKDITVNSHFPSVCFMTSWVYQTNYLWKKNQNKNQMQHMLYVWSLCIAGLQRHKKFPLQKQENCEFNHFFWCTAVIF